MTASLEEIRAQFPALERRHGGQPVAYFDGPGGTQVPRRVADAMTDYLLHHNANTHWEYPTSAETDAMLLAAREALADLLHCTPAELAFGNNMTTLTYHVSRALGMRWGPGDEVVVTELDHHANIDPWKRLAHERGVTVRQVKVDVATGELNWASFESCLGPRTRLVAIGAASNALGTMTDLPRAIGAARAVGALTYVDAVHFAPHALVDVRALDCDFLACSPYKFYGPHAGLLYGKPALLQRFGRYKVRPAHDLWETGTPAFEAMAGVTAAIDHLAWIGSEFGDSADRAPLDGRRGQLRAGLKAITRYETGLVRLLLDGLDELGGVRVRGITDRARMHERTSIVSFTMDFATPDEAAEHLGRDGIQVWSGDFYAPNAIEALGLTEQGGVLRIGLMSYNTADEVQRLLDSLTALAASRR